MPHGPPHKAEAPISRNSAIWIRPRLAGAFLPHSPDIKAGLAARDQHADGAVFESSRPEDAPQDLTSRINGLPSIGPPPAQRRAAEMADGRDIEDLDRRCGQ